MTADDRARLGAAETLVRAGRIGQAIQALRELTAARPNLAAAHELLATALETSGDRVGAENALRVALTTDPGAASAATRLAIILTARRRPSEAVRILEPFVGGPSADVRLLTAYGSALKSLERREDAVEAYTLAAKAAPEIAAAQHNLAGALGDAHRFSESETAMRKAFAMGQDAPESRLVLGRALLGLMRLDEADDAFREAIRRRPSYAEAHAELAQLIWMRTEDLAAATEAMNVAMRSNTDPALCLAKAKVLEYAGDVDGAYVVLTEGLSTRPHDPHLRVAAALLILPRDAELGLEHAEKAFAAAPDLGPTAAALCQANLAMGRGDTAAAMAEVLCRDWPLDQHPVTLLATALRIKGDDRYRRLYDYDRLVRTWTIDTPSGWTCLDAYLADLASSLKGLQRLKAHPIGQSLRNGAQTAQSLARSPDPVIRAFFSAIDAPIRAYIAMLADHDDVLGRRVTAGYRFSGAWSVLLRPGGHHVNHIHPMGWISSAFHVELPDAVENGRQGWLKFGEPGLPTSPVLGPEHFVKPRAGNLVLFPSYMWHGTVPFGGKDARLAAAFDLLPA